MSDYHRLLDEVREDSRPGLAQVRRVEAEVSRRTTPQSRAPALLGGALLAAAAAIALVSTLLPVDVGRALDHTGPIALGGEVNVDAEGVGEVQGTSRDMTVEWRKGTLAVDVTPEQGVQLAVTTSEATIRVVGTGFDVDRGALGTTVTVRHGRVSVDCVRGGLAMLEAGERRTCEPVSAAGALRRVLALEKVVPPSELLGEIEGALARPGGSEAIHLELEALRADALLALGRDTEALTTLERALANPEVTRAEELHRKAARLRLGAGDCAGALPHLDALAGHLDAREIAALEHCRPISPRTAPGGGPPRPSGSSTR